MTTRKNQDAREPDGLPLRWAFILMAAAVSAAGAWTLADPAVAIGTGLAVVGLGHRVIR